MRKHLEETLQNDEDEDTTGIRCGNPSTQSKPGYGLSPECNIFEEV